MKNYNTLFALGLTLALTGLAPAALAAKDDGDGHAMNGHMDHHGAAHDHAMDHGEMSMSETAKDGMTRAKVMGVDRDRRRVTLNHEPIESVGMPGMTMPFPVGPDVDLDAVEQGDDVRFTLKHGTMMVDRLEPER
ncbi:copper-binding protein [uncultured Abyssibacter sp.]|uniref:copper-binding protein n=1 Tax=uncultured Abyssibacter sp. TaxID=2320202 RepID=UPI0032B2217B